MDKNKQKEFEDFKQQFQWVLDKFNWGVANLSAEDIQFLNSWTTKLDDVVEAYKNEEVKRALELGFEYGADWQEVGLPSKTQALESAFENYLNSNKD